MGWRDELVPASFRGVPFEVDGHSFGGGRRTVTHEFAGRDKPYTEDMGRKAQKFSVRGYVIGSPFDDSYFAQRDALAHACQMVRGPGILSHPWLGTNLSVCCETVSFHEDEAAGGMAVFDLTFVEAGYAPSPLAVPDTAGQIIAGVGSVMAVIGQVTAIAQEIAAAPAILIGMAEGLVGEVVGDVLGVVQTVFGTVAGVLLPLGEAALAVAGAVSSAEAVCGAVAGAFSEGVALVTGSVCGITGDPVTVAVLDMFSAATAAVLALQNAPPDALDAVGGELFTAQRMAADPTLGLAALASFGAALPAPTGLRVDLQAQLQTDLVNLVTGAATLAVAQIFAATDFTSAGAAASARGTLLGLINAQITAAAAARQNRLYQAWMALAGQAGADLLARVQQLPTLGAYQFSTGLPACVIAQRLYQDGTRATELQMLNDCPHPGFLPPAGVALGN